ncbi:hypothetical protein [Corynebacterium glutamicum]|nr:hypothetical protein [Corynebacterium glutamicum]
MTLLLKPILQAAGINPEDALAMRHVFIPIHEDTNSNWYYP